VGTTHLTSNNAVVNNSHVIGRHLHDSLSILGGHHHAVVSQLRDMVQLGSNQVVSAEVNCAGSLMTETLS
jgi:hypothetical protein